MPRSGPPPRGPSSRKPAARRSDPAARRRDPAARRPDPNRRRTPGVGRPAQRAARVRRTGGLTTRAAVLALIVCAMTLALTVPLREYVRQRGRVAALEERTREQQARVAELEENKRRLQDPAYVEKLARERLRFVRPGEVPYVVITPAPAPSPTGAKPGEPAPAADDAWYAQLWDTVEGAGRS